jgi:hypothetical protein
MTSSSKIGFALADSLERPGSIYIEVLGFAHSGVCRQIRVVPTESALRFHGYARLFLTLLYACLTLFVVLAS